ncbi:response regulator transcription factor [Caminibacter pacificus]
MNILIVEDDYDLHDTIKDFLELQGFKCDSAFDGQSAVEKIYEKDFDVVILDVKLPEMNGFEVAKRVREFSKVPIIFLTSLDGEKDVEEGFLSGGDDYIRKPFSLKELKLRIDAIIKRVYGDSERVKIRDFEFDLKNMTLYKDGKEVHLKPKHAKLLKLFIKNKNQVVSKDEIFNAIYDYDEEVNENSLRVFIKDLRNILGKDSIETLKDRGYRFVG